MSAPEHPAHGGDLHSAIAHHGIPRAEWLDLSTGISPFPWPVPPVPASVWQRLPEADGLLEQAARQYYGISALPIPGSQWAIEQLPRLFPRSQVHIPAESYEEHRFWWQQHGHCILPCQALPDAQQLDQRDIVIVLNPNNPTARYHSTPELLALAQNLRNKNGWLIVDEAFMDATPDQSLLPLLTDDLPILVLRSMGKFFGLAGIRLGFVCGHSGVRDQLQQRLGPWAINHPAQWIGSQALQDTAWQQGTRLQLQQQGQQLAQLLQRRFDSSSLSATPLFTSIAVAPGSAPWWQNQLAQQGIWIRCFPQWNRLRFGLGDQAGLERLAVALERINP